MGSLQRSSDSTAASMGEESAKQRVMGRGRDGENKEKIKGSGVVWRNVRVAVSLYSSQRCREMRRL